ncbi:MAG: chemotaxis protein CheX [Syntrophotaleaceae bacterium]
MDLNKSICSATVEVFQTMLMMDAVPGDPLTGRKAHHSNSVSGIVGIAGPSKGMVAIHIPEQTALKITSSFLCMEVSSIDEDVKDAIGELANMVAGSIKADLLDGKDYKLSIPSVVNGVEYEIECLSESQGGIVPFSVDGGEFIVEFHLQG